MAGLNDPAPGAPGRVADLLGQLVAARLDVWLEVLIDDPRSQRVEVIATVQAQTLSQVFVRDRAGDRDRRERELEQLYVVTVGAIVRKTDRDPGGVGEDRSLRPLLARSVGFGPVAGPPSGAFVIAPSAASQPQSMPTCSS